MKPSFLWNGILYLYTFYYNNGVFLLLAHFLLLYFLFSVKSHDFQSSQYPHLDPMSSRQTINLCWDWFGATALFCQQIYAYWLIYSSRKQVAFELILQPFPLVRTLILVSFLYTASNRNFLSFRPLFLWHRGFKFSSKLKIYSQTLTENMVKPHFLTKARQNC